MKRLSILLLLALVLGITFVTAGCDKEEPVAVDEVVAEAEGAVHDTVATITKSIEVGE